MSTEPEEPKQPEEPPQKKADEPKPEDILERERKRSEDYRMRLAYAQADLENLKRRSERQIEEAKNFGNERLIIQLLDVTDELELAVQAGRSADSSEAVVQGVEMTLAKLQKILKNEGVSPIESLGKPFDASKHNAVARVEKEDVEGCQIIEEIRKGYIMKGKVIRPSIVKVAIKPSSTERKDNEQC